MYVWMSKEYVFFSHFKNIFSFIFISFLPEILLFVRLHCHFYFKIRYNSCSYFSTNDLSFHFILPLNFHFLPFSFSYTFFSFLPSFHLCFSLNFSYFFPLYLFIYILLYFLIQLPFFGFLLFLLFISFS